MQDEMDAPEVVEPTLELREEEVPRVGTADNLDKVRDILFGSQARNFERHIERLEGRISKEATQLREEMRDRLSGLERYLKDELSGMQERLKAEERRRGSEDDSIIKELQTLARTFDRRAEDLDERMTRGERDLRDQLLQTSKRFGDDLQSRIQEILQMVEREARELRSDKTDRRALASLLNEVAMRLSEESAD